MQQAEIDTEAFARRFPNEAACLAFIRQARWPSSVVSPFCGGDAYEIKTRPGLFKCKETRQQFSLRRGTIFEDSNIPVRKWFFLVYILTSVRRVTDSRELAKLLGVTPKTAQFMLDRIITATSSKEFAELSAAAASYA